MQTVPVTVLTGFLGCGKTTLLNRILTADHGIKVGVLLNEFGEINIDSRLIARRDDTVMELSNGCVCCTVRDDLLRSIAALLERPAPPEHIVIETTGLADPVPVAEQLLDPRVQSDIRLDAIVTLVDAANFDRNLERAEQAYSQIATGDIVLVNKTDLVEPPIIDRIESGVRTLNPRARVVRCVQAGVDLTLILGLGLFEPSALSARRAPNGAPAVEPPGRGVGDDGHDARHQDTHGFASLALRRRATVDLERFARLLDALSPSVFRAKGVLAVREVPARIIFHLVGDRWTLTAGDAWQPGEDRVSEMVFIGTELHGTRRADLERRVAACLDTPQA
jgi:G3E family GTPase